MHCFIVLIFQIFVSSTFSTEGFQNKVVVAEKALLFVKACIV